MWSVDDLGTDERLRLPAYAQVSSRSDMYGTSASSQPVIIHICQPLMLVFYLGVDPLFLFETS